MHLTENWRLKGQRYTLTTTRNNETQEITFPPRHVARRELDVYTFDEQEVEVEVRENESESVAPEGLAQ